MGAGGVPNRTVVIVNGRSGSLPTKGAKPNSRYDLYYNGVKIQSRWFDNKGYVVRNRDYMHQNSHYNHTFPHDHRWYRDNEKLERDPNFIEPDYDNFN